MRKANGLMLILLGAVSLLAQGGPGQGTGIATGTGTRTATLTTAEKDRLLLMREEEKMAGDVYRFLAEKWNIRIFTNIAESEDRHFEQVGRLLTRYGLEDPAAGTGPGEYRSGTIAALYSELTTKGSASLKDALEVGVAIETLDIQDLVTGMLETKMSDIRRVYTNLMNASVQHLEAFETSLETVLAL